MPILPLHFKTAADVCNFLKASKLQSFLLLGKQSTLIAQFTEAEISFAKAIYGASAAYTPETFQLIRDHFKEEVLPVYN